MAANPIFLDEAIEELVDAVIYYETEAPPGTAQRLAFEANAIIQRVIEAPRRWPVEDKRLPSVATRNLSIRLAV